MKMVLDHRRSDIPAVGVSMCGTCDVRIHYVGVVTRTNVTAAHAAGAARMEFSPARLSQTDTHKMSGTPR